VNINFPVGDSAKFFAGGNTVNVEEVDEVSEDVEVEGGLNEAPVKTPDVT